ncbi:hypothetical protein BAG01nite_12860 [Brevibacillus agri]|uniref:TOTE conflict system primase domain-containing protein n=1 Tax=Brevibacillus agri TaxID=51101 RepID=A0A3M8ASY5_9BACL|nr:hypothetical protein [Brevibacillus agri]MDN4094176.1 hypothetical protein [Brevibacillus agri]QAV13237.1 hypothetical protein BA6348_11030 [Brevibacillus agri]RNB54123.1 hypothetical protein EB820_14515 [Brevibacillus agri]GED25184.1 hypothetical protein BAG01nite_12860 [Brevibacillus agri]
MTIDQKIIINKLNDLYFIQRKHYLIQYKEPIGYRQYTAGHINSKGKKVKPLQDWQFEKHLEGEYTIGTFAKFFSKFMTFDVDFQDKQMAKWITYNVANTLNGLGIKHYISYSGNKGYHIDLFFEDLIRVDYAEKFFQYAISQSDIEQYFDEANKVEFRVTDKLGVKIPLGIHQRTGNFCGFCLIEDGLRVMDAQESQEYLLSIEKMKSETIIDIIGESGEKIKKKTIIQTEDALAQHKPLPSYEPNEDYSIDRAINLLHNGLQIQGSRNNSIFLVGLYFKYMGLEQEQTIVELYKWMELQNPDTYTTKLEECYKEIDRTVKNMYEKNYNLTANVKDLTVTYTEIKWIIEHCPEKNQKLIAYAMLIHSKRFANAQGVFYMTFKDIEKVTGLYDQAVQRQVNKLIELGVIEVVERNRKQKGKGLQKKLPNLYRMNIVWQNSAERNDNPSLDFENYIPNKQNDFSDCLKFYFTDKELKKILPRRQYESLVG